METEVGQGFGSGIMSVTSCHLDVTLFIPLMIPIVTEEQVCGYIG